MNAGQHPDTEVLQEVCRQVFFAPEDPIAEEQ